MQAYPRLQHLLQPLPLINLLSSSVIFEIIALLYKQACKVV